MKKSLQTIQSLARIGKVLSNIVFVASIVCAVLFGIAALLIYFGIQESIHIDGLDIQSLLSDTAGYTLDTLFSLCVAGFFTCLFEAILSKIAARYFKTQISAATPFTITCVKGMKRLGILTIVLPLAGTVVAGIVSGLLIGFDAALLPEFTDITGSTSISLGVMFLILSVVFKYGTEILWEKSTANRSADAAPRFDIISRTNAENADDSMAQDIAARVEGGFGPGIAPAVEPSAPDISEPSESANDGIDDIISEAADFDVPADQNYDVAAIVNDEQFASLLDSPQPEADGDGENIDDFITRFKLEFGKNDASDENEV